MGRAAIYMREPEIEIINLYIKSIVKSLIAIAF